MKQVLLRYNNNHRGFGLVEVAIGAAIVLVGVVSLLASFNFYIQYALANARTIQAAYLAEEGIEAAKFMRDYSWDTHIDALAEGTTYHLVWEDAMWKATSTAQGYIDGMFMREIVFSEVYRDGNSDIAETGTIDANTRLVTVTVSYRAGHATSTKSIATYITNLFNN